MKAQHTPGPWHMPVEGSQYLLNARSKRRAFPVADDATGGAVARIEWRPRDGEQEANARLISAAPELLEACRAAKVFIRNGVALGYIRMPDKDVPDPAHKTPEMLRAAIAKATGKE